MKYSKDIVKEICKYLKIGNNRQDSAALSGITKETFYQWLKHKPYFSDAVKRAELEGKNERIKIILQAAIKNWQAAAWHLERKYPEEFALKIKNELSGDLKTTHRNRIDMSRISDDVLKKLASMKINQDKKNNEG